MYDVFGPMDDSKLHIKSQGRCFATTFYLTFAFLVISTIPIIIFAGLDFNRTLHAQTSISKLVDELSNSYFLKGDCWTCDTKTQLLTFVSNDIENNLINVDDTTPHFPEQGVTINNFQTNGQTGGNVYLGGIDLSTPQTDGTPTTSFILGNMTRNADSSVVGLPVTHSSVMAVGIYNGDNNPVNTRCTQISNTVIYIRYNFNNIINSTEYRLCLCDNQLEYCLLYSNVQFNNQTTINPV